MIRSINSDSLSACSDSEVWQQNKETKTVVHKNILLEILQNLSKDCTYSENNLQESNQKNLNIELNEEEYLNQIPEPIESEEELSKEVQYFSYLEVFLPKDESQSESVEEKLTLREKMKWIVRKEFLSLLYKCVIYVRKNEKRTEVDDQLLSEILNDHLEIKVLPSAKSVIGQALMVNGYFLSAFAILFARINRSSYLLRYIFDKFHEEVNKIEENKSEFVYYFEKHADFFGIQSEEIENKVDLDVACKYAEEKSIASEKLDRSTWDGHLKRTHLQPKNSIEKENNKYPNAMLETKASIGHKSNSYFENNQTSPDC